MRQPKSQCLDAIHRAKREFGDTDIYDIYEKKCRYDSKCAAPAPERALSWPAGRGTCHGVSVTEGRPLMRGHHLAVWRAQ